MPRRKRCIETVSKKKALNKSDISIADEETTISSANECDINLLNIEVKEKYHKSMQKLKSMLEFEMSVLDMAFRNIICSLTDSELNTRVDLVSSSMNLY